MYALLRCQLKGHLVKFQTYAEVLTADHPLTQAIANGTKKTRGALLRDILHETGGRYEITVEMPHRMREDLRRMASLTSDDRLADFADQTEVTISLEHLRQHDPNTTRIVYGCRLSREPEDGELPGIDR